MVAVPLPADGAAPGSGRVDVEVVGRRVEELLGVIGDAEPAARTAAEDLLRELLGLYGAALERLVAELGKTDAGALRRLAADPLLAGLLVLHDLHPLDVRARVEQAVAGFPDVTVTDVSGEAVHLAVAGGCRCGAPLPVGVEEAVRGAAPEITRVVVDGGGHGNGLIPPSAITVRRERA